MEQETQPQNAQLLPRPFFFIFGMAAIPIPLWFGDSMQGQSLS